MQKTQRKPTILVAAAGGGLLGAIVGVLRHSVFDSLLMAILSFTLVFILMGFLTGAFEDGW